MTEADLAREIFKRVAEGDSAINTARWLSGIGVTPTKYYAGRVLPKKHAALKWHVSRVNSMLKSPTYRGEHTFESMGEPIVREVPALVDADTWHRVQAQLTRNKKLSTRGAKHSYLLRGLIRCGLCGAGYSGNRNARGSWTRFYYRCNRQVGTAVPEPSQRCKGKQLPGDWLESLVWEDVKAFVQKPGPYLQDARRQLAERIGEATKAKGQLQALQKTLLDKEGERERVLTLFRRGKVTVEDIDRHLDAINKEAGTLRDQIKALESRAAIASAWEVRVLETERLLMGLKGEVLHIDRTGDTAKKRQLIELLVNSIRVDTTGEGKDRKASVLIHYAFAESGVVTTKSGYTASPHSHT
jgi:site-specific DNA recombinase